MLSFLFAQQWNTQGKKFTDMFSGRRNLRVYVLRIRKGKTGFMVAMLIKD